MGSNVRGGRLSFSTTLVILFDPRTRFSLRSEHPPVAGRRCGIFSYVYAAAREIASALEGFTVVITKSTVPVGTGDEVERIIWEVRPDANAAVVSNPEFLREGAAIYDFKHPDRIIVGTTDERAKKVMGEIYGL